ncbi:hypothetical protein TNCV_1571911 [Trichonephila clavipes]|uniref:Uncharacterized protein n=1 Tax=Trichonephila clavipes TaxID=2585209 RepID=A0A8X6VQ12_TRICX|nr:hypothetical protein TNCV_1571911 [Trichonephila clavipes]
MSRPITINNHSTHLIEMRPSVEQQTRTKVQQLSECLLASNYKATRGLLPTSLVSHNQVTRTTPELTDTPLLRLPSPANGRT